MASGQVLTKLRNYYSKAESQIGIWNDAQVRPRHRCFGGSAKTFVRSHVRPLVAETRGIALGHCGKCDGEAAGESQLHSSLRLCVVRANQSAVLTLLSSLPPSLHCECHRPCTTPQITAPWQKSRTTPRSCCARSSSQWRTCCRSFKQRCESGASAVALRSACALEGRWAAECTAP